MFEGKTRIKRTQYMASGRRDERERAREMDRPATSGAQLPEKSDDLED
jgi:hypothetical protein